MVVIEFIFIFYLETIATTSALTAKVFGLTTSQLSDPTVQLLFRNQGIYNLAIAIILLYALFISRHKKDIITIMLIFIIVVAVYGGYSSDWMIAVKQGSLPLVALISLSIKCK
jgi:Predicted membrane protein